MTTQDETIFRDGQNNPQAAAAVVNEEATTKRNAPRWQTVTIGGIAGIAMGVAASQAYGALTADNGSVELVDETEEGTADVSADATVTEVHQATVNQNLSFSEAFAAARAEVGAGGVFLWHGQLYNTYTAEEWQGMSDAQKDEFANDVEPYLGQQTVQVSHTTTHTETVRTETTHINGPVHQTVHTEEDTAEPEVHFLGVETGDVEGQTVNIGHMTVDNVSVALVDVDNDQIFDVRVIDANRNGQLDEGDDIADISGNGLTVGDFQMLSEMEQAQTDQGQLEQAHNMQEDLAPDMPDYMNDADVDIV